MREYERVDREPRVQRMRSRGLHGLLRSDDERAMNYETTIEVDGRRYTIRVLSLPGETDAPRYLKLAENLIRNADSPPAGGIECDDVIIRIGQVMGTPVR